MIWLDFLLFWLSLRSNVIPASIPRLGYKIMWFSIIAANAAQQVFRGARETWCEFFTPRSSTWRLRHFGTRACDSMPTGARQSTNQKLCNFNSDFFFFFSFCETTFICGRQERIRFEFFVWHLGSRKHLFFLILKKYTLLHFLYNESETNQDAWPESVQPFPLCFCAIF